MKPGTKVKLVLPETIFIDFTDDRSHMIAHEHADHCRPTALVGRYILVETILPQERTIRD